MVCQCFVLYTFLYIDIILYSNEWSLYIWHVFVKKKLETIELYILK